MATADSALKRAERAQFPTFYSAGGRIMIAALVLTAALCTMDRMVLSLVVDPVRQDLGLSETEIGLLQGLSFSLMYSLAGIPLGLMADRVARGKLLAAAVFIWSLGTLLCGLATDFHFFFLARMLVGTGEAALWPVAVSLIGDLAPTRNRGNLVGLVIIGQLLGSSFSLIVGGQLLEMAHAGQLSALPVLGGHVPWRMLFMLYGSFGIAAILLLLMGKEPPRSDVGDAQDKPKHPLAGISIFYRFMQANWKVVGSLYLLTAIIAAVQYSGAAWNVPMLLRRFDYGPKEIGLIVGIMSFAAGALGSVSGGFLTRLTGNSPTARCNILIGAYFACLIYATLIFNPGFIFSLAAFGVPAVLIAMAGVVKIVILQDIIPANMRGVATAISHLFANLLGATLGPLVVAMITQYGFKDDQMVGVSLGIVVGVSLLAAILFGLVIRRQMARREPLPA